MTTAKPNLIWILSDQHRGQAMSFAGDPNVSTPNLDRMAAEGVWFRRAITGTPLCCPARGSILTGRYPHQAIPGHEQPLPQGIPTLADPFNQAGYDTAWFGKWHVDGFRESGGRAAFHTVPRSRRGGFQTWIGYENNNAQFDSYCHGHRDDAEIDRFRLPTFETDALTDSLLEHITARSSGARPFFAVLSVQPPHDPYTAPESWMQRHRPADIKLRANVPPIASVREQARRELAGYYALIENIDWNIGRVRKHLETLGLTNGTHIVYFSDHGDHHGSHGHFRKLTPYQEAIHVPLIIGGPTHRHYEVDHISTALLNHVDIAPTSLGLCGIDVPESMAGFDYSREVVRRPNADEHPPAAALLQSVVPTGHGPSVDQPWRGLLTIDGWKYIAFSGAPYLLFNLNEDPYELRNLAHHAHAASKRTVLHRQLVDLLSSAGDPFTFWDRGGHTAPGTHA
ncbi:MAG: sulfatase [Planctomycetota bacterium]